MAEDDDGYAVAHGHAVAQRFRLPGDALELMRYKLEEALKKTEAWKDNYDVTVKNMIAEYDEAQARIQELEQEMERWRKLYYKTAQMVDYWRAKAGG